MPIDDTIIDAKLVLLKAKIRTLNDQRRILELIVDRLIQVKTIEKPAIIPTDPPIREIPIDNQTGSRFTIQRRQSIFDQGITDADAALV